MTQAGLAKVEEALSQQGDLMIGDDIVSALKIERN